MAVRQNFKVHSSQLPITTIDFSSELTDSKLSFLSSTQNVRPLNPRDAQTCLDGDKPPKSQQRR